METSGRERRHRYYTIRHYRQFVNEESLDNQSAPYCDIDLGDVGGFSIVDPDAFYETEEDRIRYISSFKSEHDSSEKKKTRIYKNPILPDGTVKRGRPRKKILPDDDIGTGATVKHQRKRKNAENEEEKRASKKVRISEPSLDPPICEP